MSVEQVRALEAGTFIGNDALAQGLVDEVATLDDLMTTAATGSVPAKDGSAQAANGEKKMSKLYEDAIAGLRKAAESDDAEEAKKAKRMLQAELAEDSDGDSDKPEPKKEDAKADDSDGDGSDEPKKEDAKAEGDAPAMPPKKDEDAKAMAARAIAKVESFEAAQAKAAEVSERRELLATRPDFSQEVLATLANASIETVRGAVKTWPRGPARKPAAAISAIGTRGDGQGDGEASHLPPAEKLALDRAMGLVDEKPGVRADGNRLILGEFMPVKTDDKGAR
jgi:hypothetical protein